MPQGRKPGPDATRQWLKESGTVLLVGAQYGGDLLAEWADGRKLWLKPHEVPTRPPSLSVPPP